MRKSLLVSVRFKSYLSEQFHDRPVGLEVEPDAARSRSGLAASDDGDLTVRAETERALVPAHAPPAKCRCQAGKNYYFLYILRWTSSHFSVIFGRTVTVFKKRHVFALREFIGVCRVNCPQDGGREIRNLLSMRAGAYAPERFAGAPTVPDGNPLNSPAQSISPLAADQHSGSFR